MKKITLLLFLLSLGLYAQESNRIIIKLKQGVASKNIALKNNLTGIDKIDAVNATYNYTAIQKLHSGKKSNDVLFVISFPDNINIQLVIKDFTRTELVEYAEIDGVGHTGGMMTNAPNDDYYNRQWSLKNNGSFSLSAATAGADIDMESAWDIEQGSSTIIVATMDSGLRLGHPEFEGRLWINAGEIANNNTDDDNNGYVDDINGYDFVNNDNTPTDDLGHGTNVTGIIGANGNNSIGYAGVDRTCKLMTLKGINSANSGQYSWWYDAIVYAADNGANVINLSVGGSSASATLKSAIDYAVDNGVVAVVCMMNTNSNTPYYPAKYANVIAVGSTNPDDTRSAPFFWDPLSGSNYGSHISVVAPGNFIYGLSQLSDNYYDTYWGGTSQATPHITGLVALLLAQDNTRTPAQIKQIIEDTAEDQVGNPAEDTPGYDVYYGHGRINAYNALAASLGIAQNTLVSKAISIYPNPSKGTVSIDSPNYPATVTVCNMLGQQVLQKEINSNNNTITVNTTGIYLISVKAGASTVTKKVIFE